MMQFYALIFGAMGLLFWMACCLLGACVVLAVVSTMRANLRNVLSLWLCSAGLFVVLWAVPRLAYYTAYGIGTKVHIYSTTGHWLSVITFALASTIRGKAKWPGLIGSVLAFLLISLAGPG